MIKSVFRERFRDIALLILASLALTACGHSAPSESAQIESLQLSETASTAMENYERVARGFVAAVDAGASAEALKPQAQQLLDYAEIVGPDYMRIFPSCKAHLTGALMIGERWQALSPEQIETDYHAGEALSPVPTGSNCYHMKDVIVHPATALALLDQPDVDRGKVRAEIAEVIAHAVAVRTGVGFNSADGD